jgi:predicted lipoprotein
MRKFLMNRGLPTELERRFQVQLCVGAALWGLLGCSPEPLPDGERRVALRRTTEQVIVPTYRELSTTTEELSSLLAELARSPDAVQLADVREAYLATRAPLEESQAFAFGPAEQLRSAAALDQQPIDRAKIDAELEGDAELTSQYLRRIGANKRGLHGIEYLLFPESDAALEQALLDAGDAGARRRQYRASAAEVVATAAAELQTAWDAPEPEVGYARRFSEPGESFSVSPDVQTGLDTLLNQVVFLSEVVANDKLGKPLGAATGGEVDPSAQESERSGASLTDALGNLRGMRNIYFGSRDDSVGPSLSSLVRAKSPSADQHARAALEAAEASLLAVPEPLGDALVDAPETVMAAFEAVKNLKRVLATEVLGTLGASLKFNDNDGD